MTTQTPTLAGYSAYGIGKLSHGMDGGVQADCYYLLPTEALGPPRFPRPVEPDELVAGPRVGCALCVLSAAVWLALGWWLASLI